MHAVVARSTIDDVDSSLSFLKEQVLPHLSEAPGFIAGYWVKLEGKAGASMVLFENEQAARVAAERISPPAGVTILSREIGEVVAEAKAATHA